MRLAMRQASHELTIDTHGAGLVEITRDIAHWLAAQRIDTGLLTVFCRHTSASMLLNENAAPAVQRDIARFFDRIAPENAGYEHDDEGPDDMPAHLKTALTQQSLSIPVANGAMVLGTWQGVFLFEHRAAPHRRHVVLHVIGD